MEWPRIERGRSCRATTVDDCENEISQAFLFPTPFPFFVRSFALRLVPLSLSPSPLVGAGASGRAASVGILQFSHTVCWAVCDYRTRTLSFCFLFRIFSSALVRAYFRCLRFSRAGSLGLFVGVCSFLRKEEEETFSSLRICLRYFLVSEYRSFLCRQNSVVFDFLPPDF